MLYIRRLGTDDAEPRPLNNPELAEKVAFFQMIPVEEHRIDYIKFNNPSDNEVMCTVIMLRGEHGAPDATTKFFFTPVCYLNTWRLILTDNRQGEIPIVPKGDRDSLERHYRAVQTR